MSELIFEELDYQRTAFGDISLRKRTEPRLDNCLIYEVKLGDEFLMSSLFVEAEEQLSKLGLARLKKHGVDCKLDIVVGGLGLGYTSVTALSDPAVSRLRTIDVMQPVISWHQQGLLPVGDLLARDTRSDLVHGNFFEIAQDDAAGFIDNAQVDAVFLDIDHSPSHWLNPENKQFYTPASLSKMARKIKPGGVFGLWSNESNDDEVLRLLETSFIDAQAHTIEFANPYSGGQSLNTVYLAQTKHSILS